MSTDIVLPEIVVQVGTENTAKSSGQVTLTYSKDKPFTLDPSKEVQFLMTYTPENNGKDKVIELQLPRYFDLLEVPLNTELITIEETDAVLGADEFWSEETEVDSLRTVSYTHLHRLVYHGRAVCTARTTPHCERCCISDICASANTENNEKSREKNEK